LVSAFSRNPCPLWSGIGVRFAQEQVSALRNILHMGAFFIHHQILQ
jgi:hypothetical protein